jgi:modulator of FtsH protease
MSFSSPDMRQFTDAPTFPGRDASVVPYLRRVYALFTGGVGFAILGALVALYAGTPVALPGTGLAVPPVVAFGMQHWIIMMLVFFGAAFGAQAARRTPVLNVAVLFGFTFVAGLFIAPSLFIAQYLASQGATLATSPVRDAFLLSGAAFVGLTSYVLVTRRDFSFLAAGLSMGLWVVLGGLILGLFLHSAVLQLAVASVGVLLFCGYILYDTSRLLQARDERDPVGAALRLFLDVMNLFLFLLRIFSSRRR